MVLDRFSLKGKVKVAIVTGAGRGIGKGIATAFAEAGADVACVDQNAESAHTVAEEVRGTGRRALAVACDVREKTRWPAWWKVPGTILAASTYW